jgi:intracellular sulfur oxidation DsrE/DsrF family protein
MVHTTIIHTDDTRLSDHLIPWSTHVRILASLLIGSAIATSLLPAHAAAQRTSAGPMIHSAGAVFAVSPDLPTPVDRDYRLAFEISTPSASPDALNPSINTVARFLNMHAQAGVPQDRLHGAIVAHGGGAFEMMDDPAYRAKFGVDNPNGALIRELIAAGQPVLLCGQSAASRGITPDQLIPGVKVALSAMTAFLLLQDEGYRVNPW